MSTCTLDDPGPAAGWPLLAGLDPFGRLSGDGDPASGSLFDLVPIYNGPHSLTILVGDTLPSGAGLSWDADGFTLVHTGTMLRGSLALGSGVGYRATIAGITNTEPLDDPARYTDAQAPYSGNLDISQSPGVLLDNYLLNYSSAGPAKNLQWRVKIDPAAAGNFTLTLTTAGNVGKPNGTFTTAPIPVGSTLLAVESAITALPNVGHSSSNPARPNISVLGTVGNYDLVFEAGAFHDEIYVTAASATGPVTELSSRVNIFGGEGPAMGVNDTQNLLARKLFVKKCLCDGVKWGGANYDMGLVNSTIQQNPGRGPIGGHTDGFIPKGLDNTGTTTGRTPRYAADLCLIDFYAGNAGVFISAGQTVMGAQGVIIKRSLIKHSNKAMAQNGCDNHKSGMVDCWYDSTQISDASAHDQGGGACPGPGVHGKTPEWVWQNVRRSDARGADPRGFQIGPPPGPVIYPEPAGYVSLCSSGGPPPDTTAPSTPTGLAASPFVGGVDLSWDASTD